MSIDAARKQAILTAFGGCLAVVIGSIVVYAQRGWETLFIPAIVIIGWATVGGALVQLLMGKRAEQGLGRLFVLLGGVVVGFLGGVFTFALLLATDAPTPEEETSNPYAEEDRANLAAISDLQVASPIVLDRTLVVERGPGFDPANFSALAAALQSHPQVDLVSYSAEEGQNLLFKAALLDRTKVDAAALSVLTAPLDCKVVEVR